jgi:hypothetical protein
MCKNRTTAAALAAESSQLPGNLFCNLGLSGLLSVCPSTMTFWLFESFMDLDAPVLGLQVGQFFLAPVEILFCGRISELQCV